MPTPKYTQTCGHELVYGSAENVIIARITADSPEPARISATQLPPQCWRWEVRAPYSRLAATGERHSLGLATADVEDVVACFMLLQQRRE